MASSWLPDAQQRAGGIGNQGLATGVEGVGWAVTKAPAGSLRPLDRLVGTLDSNVGDPSRQGNTAPTRKRSDPGDVAAPDLGNVILAREVIEQRARPVKPPPE